MIFFLLLFIVIVAAFSVTSSLLISVVRKTREIGLLGALGGPPARCGRLLLRPGGLHRGPGNRSAGWRLGFGALAIRNDVVFGLRGSPSGRRSSGGSTSSASCPPIRLRGRHRRDRRPDARHRHPRGPAARLAGGPAEARGGPPRRMTPMDAPVLSARGLRKSYQSGDGRIEVLRRRRPRRRGRGERQHPRASPDRASRPCCISWPGSTTPEDGRRSPGPDPPTWARPPGRFPRHGLPGLLPHPGTRRPGKRPHGPRGCSGGSTPPPGRAPMRSWPGSGCRRAPVTCPPSSPAASASGSPWRGR